MAGKISIVSKLIFFLIILLKYLLTFFCQALNNVKYCIDKYKKAGNLIQLKKRGGSS